MNYSSINPLLKKKILEGNTSKSQRELSLGSEIYNAYFLLFTLLSHFLPLRTLIVFFKQILVEEDREIILSGNFPRVSEKLLNDTETNHPKTK